MKQLIATIVGSLTLVLLGGVQAGAAAAPTQGSINGVAISPAIQQFVLAPNQSTFSFSVQLYNHTNQPVTFSFSSADFTSLNETGGIAFLGSNVNSVQKSHELSSFLQIGDQTLTLGPNAAATVPINITNIQSMALGGHYGSILAQVVPNSGAKAGNRVNLNQVVSSLVFVETAGQGTKTIKLLPPSLDKLAFSLPNNLNLFFAATGNTQTTPRGDATVYKSDPASPTLSGIVNTDSSLVLPGSTRSLATTLTGNAHPLWPGVYHFQLQYSYDGSLGVSTYQQSFLYINLPFLAVLLVVLMLLVFGIRRLLKWPGFWRWLRLAKTLLARPRKVPAISQTIEPPSETAIETPNEVSELSETAEPEVPEAEPEAVETAPEIAETAKPKTTKVKVIIAADEAKKPAAAAAPKKPKAKPKTKSKPKPKTAAAKTTKAPKKKTAAKTRAKKK